LFFLARNTLRSKLFCSPPLMFWDKTFWLFLPEVFSLFFQLFARYSARKFFYNYGLDLATSYYDYDSRPQNWMNFRAHQLPLILMYRDKTLVYVGRFFVFTRTHAFVLFFFYKNIYSLARGRIFLKPTPREYIFLNTARECQALNNFYRNLP